MHTATAPTPAAAQITALQQVREYPAISILLTTTPAAQLSPADALRLNALITQAVDRIRTELQPAASAPAVRRLHVLVEQARCGPATHALALYASASTDALIRLPIVVRDRAVVDPTFATRDLVRALHRTSRHLILAINSAHARLFDAAGDNLIPALSTTFPLTAARPDTRSRGRADRPTRTPGDDVDHPDVIDDAVDELIELVLIRGGWIAFTDPGALDHHHGLALATRR